MDISFNCDMCGQNLVVDEAGAGRLIDCPKCGQSLLVPDKPLEPAEPSAALPQSIGSPPETKQCPFCAETIKAAAIVCRYCGTDLRDPSEVRHLNQPVQTIERTGKEWKGAQLLGMIVFFICVLGGCSAIGTDASGSWFMGAVIGLLIYVGGRIGAWWHHG